MKRYCHREWGGTRIKKEWSYENEEVGSIFCNNRSEHENIKVLMLPCLNWMNVSILDFTQVDIIGAKVCYMFGNIGGLKSIDFLCSGSLTYFLNYSIFLRRK